MSKLDNLRPHQTRALSSLRQSIGMGHRRPMVQAPTGAGKTVLAAAIVDGARRKQKKVLFVVPALSLIDQTVEAFYSEGLTEVGVMQAAHHLTDWTQPIQVASVQTLARRPMPAADLAIVDEAHRRHNFYRRWFAAPEWRDKPIIGLSAHAIMKRRFCHDFGALKNPSTRNSSCDRPCHILRFKCFPKSKAAFV
jgi:superfamily II DNA or RNA helicase